MSDFSAPVKDDNPDPRIPCALLLDTSASMAGEPITELKTMGFETFCNEIKDDSLSKKRTEGSRQRPTGRILHRRQVRGREE